MTPNGTPRNHGDEIANARAASQSEAAENYHRLALMRACCADASLSTLERENRAVANSASPAEQVAHIARLDAMLNRISSRAALPHYAGLREGDMVEDGRGYPVVLIIAAAIFALMVLGAWAIWSDPVGRTAATVMQAEGEWK